MPHVCLLWLCCASPLFAGEQLELSQVVFAETEPGVPSYPSRLLLGQDYLRLDDGSDNGDYILFEYSSGVIHSFNHEDQTHLKISPPAASPPDFELEFSVEKRVLEDAPPIDGEQPVEHVFIANGQRCRRSVNVDGLLPEVLAQFKAYQQTLVAQALQTLERLPASMRKPCYMANNYLHAVDYLDAGFPLYVEDEDGSTRQLVSFSRVSKPASLMHFVEGYRPYFATEPD